MKKNDKRDFKRKDSKRTGIKRTTLKPAVVFLAGLLILGTVGCDKDFKKDTPFDNPTEAVMGSDPTANATTTPTMGSDPVKSENVTTTPVGSDPVKGENVTATPMGSDPVKEGSDPTDAPTPTVGSDPKEGLDRKEHWEKTFLVWLPEFPSGKLAGINYAGTYDYATFIEVLPDDVKSYISTLKSAGYNNVSVEKISDSSISYTATNEKSWEVKLNYSDGILTLGSGFNDPDTGEDNKTDTLFSTTMLQYMPKFSKGTYVSSETASDATMYTSIVLTGVTESDALSYIEDVKKKGYIYVEDEGNSDGTVWYMALNDDRFECHIEFSGSEIKIGCGYLEDD